mmetsp:Transcript_138871/g.443385  ORF Transcript_138871/g.443385 Transcript_138871/m.443385 type:complete len:269 (-) Transcript_138871:1334-2140(-)
MTGTTPSEGLETSSARNVSTRTCKSAGQAAMWEEHAANNLSKPPSASASTCSSPLSAHDAARAQMRSDATRSTSASVSWQPALLTQAASNLIGGASSNRHCSRGNRRSANARVAASPSHDGVAPTGAASVMAAKVVMATALIAVCWLASQSPTVGPCSIGTACRLAHFSKHRRSTTASLVSSAVAVTLDTRSRAWSSSRRSHFRRLSPIWAGRNLARDRLNTSQSAIRPSTRKSSEPLDLATSNLCNSNGTMASLKRREPKGASDPIR